MDKVNLLKHLRDELSYHDYCLNESMRLGPSPYQEEVADYYGFELRQPHPPIYDLEDNRDAAKRLHKVINHIENQE